MPAGDARRPCVIDAVHVNEPGRHRIHPNAPGPELKRGGSRVHEDRRLRRRVVAVQERRLEALDRCDVHHAAAIGHPPGRGLGHRHDATDIDTKHLGTIVGREVQEGSNRLDPGVVHDDVEPPECRDRLVAQAVGVALNISRNDGNAFDKFRSQTFGCRPVPAGVDRHGGSRLVEATGDPGTDVAARPRHERYPTGEIEQR